MAHVRARFALRVLPLTLLGANAQAETYYVAPDGDDDNGGTLDEPFASVERAQDAAAPGDTVYIRGGSYEFVGTSSDIGVLFDKSGTEGAPIRYFAYEGEVPVFDFFQLTPQARVRGFSVRASWLHFRGLELRGVQQILTDVNESWCLRVENGASNNIFEALDLHHNEGPGLFIADGGNNLVLNVDSHHNYDPDRGGENSDGFGCHSNDPGNVFRGCRAWYNSDDGFDFINSPAACTVEYSMAFYNGYVPDTSTAAGNGAGFKAGGFGLDMASFPAVVPRHQVRFNLAFGNLAAGFYANHHPGGIDWFNNTSFDNARNFDMLADVGAADHYLRNNLAVSPGTDLAQATANEVDDAFNSWSLPVDVSEADFMSITEEEAVAPRQDDGSLPPMSFMKLVEGSDLIDVGEDAGFDFEGNAPDLGAFEFGATNPVPPGTGGSPGIGGGASGDGGAGGSVGEGGAAVGAGGNAQGGMAGTAGTAGLGAEPAGGATGSPIPTTTSTPGGGSGMPNGTPTNPTGTSAAGGGGTVGVGATTPTTPVPALGGAAGAAPAIASNGASDEGCGCRVGVHGRSAAAAWALLFVFAFVLRRRER